MRFPWRSIKLDEVVAEPRNCKGWVESVGMLGAGESTPGRYAFWNNDSKVMTVE